MHFIMLVLLCCQVMKREDVEHMTRTPESMQGKNEMNNHIRLHSKNKHTGRLSIDTVYSGDSPEDNGSANCADNEMFNLEFELTKETSNILEAKEQKCEIKEEPKATCFTPEIEEMNDKKGEQKCNTQEKGDMCKNIMAEVKVKEEYDVNEEGDRSSEKYIIDSMNEISIECSYCKLMFNIQEDLVNHICNALQDDT